MFTLTLYSLQFYNSISRVIYCEWWYIPRTFTNNLVQRLSPLQPVFFSFFFYGVHVRVASRRNLGDAGRAKYLR